MNKFDITKLAGIGATILGLAGTLLSGWASDRKTKEEITKQVAEAITKQQSN